MAVDKHLWNILRVLTTNSCNYECVYCHNEGQTDKEKGEVISINSFMRFYGIAEKIGVREVRFSGGEPLVNQDTIRMIEWLNENSTVEIGLATNGSLVNPEIASRLAKTRTLVTLHFPGVGDERYYTVTKRKWNSFENCVELFDKYNIDYSFNYTLFPNTIDCLEDVIKYSVQKGKRIKLLPFLEESFSNCSQKYIERIKQELCSVQNEYQFFDKEGVHIWSFPNGGIVKMIDSPCYGKNIELCKEYGEIRLLPDLSLMNCIFGKKISTNGASDEEIQNLFISLFDEMKSCEKLHE